MSQIDIKIVDVRKKQPALSKSASTVGNLENYITSLRYQIDSQIKHRRAIDFRIRKAGSLLIDVEANMKQINQFITLAMDQYSQVEDRIEKKAEVFATGKNPDKVKDRIQYWRNVSLFGVTASLDPHKFLKTKSGLNFKFFRKDGNVYIKIIGNMTLNPLKFFYKGAKSITHQDFEHYKKMLTKELGGTNKWTRPLVQDLVNKGVMFYDTGTKRHFKSISNKLIDTKFGDMSQFIKNASQNKFKVGLETLTKTFKEEMNVLKHFNPKRYFDTKAPKLEVGGRWFSALGFGLDVYDNADNNLKNDAGEWDLKGASGKQWKKFVVDTTVDVAAGAGATSIGATIGTAFLPPLGTVVGAAAGTLIYAGLNTKFIGEPPKSLVDATKDVANKLVDGAANVAGNIGKKLDKIFW